MKIREGYMPFGGYRTYFRVAGECEGGRKPLLALHGGPGSTHNYFEVFDFLADEGRAVVTYDQIGCGLSSMPDRPELWTLQTWMDELVAVREYLGLDEVHILGQSWGGMLLIAYLCDLKPQGVRSAVLSSANPSAALWEQEARRRLKFMSEEHQAAFAEAMLTGNYDSPAYLEANDEYLRRHADDIPDEMRPECLRRPKNIGSQAYISAWGPNEVSPTGTLKDFEYLEKMRGIRTPTLITSGVSDLCSPLIAKSMFDRVPEARWELFEHSTHMPFIQEFDKYSELLRGWLDEHD